MLAHAAHLDRLCRAANQLTIRELAASFAISKSATHRIVSTMTPRLAALGTQNRPKDRRESWVVDGTLIPTRDHRLWVHHRDPHGFDTS
jgi:hypothetical protein